MLNNHFKIVTTVTSVFLFLLHTVLAYELEWNQTEAKIELKPNEKEAKAEFVVTNKGEETVRIDHIKTSCGCTGSILDKKNIGPGESTTIIATFKKGNRSGLNHNQLQIFLKDQAEPAEILHMIVQVPRLINVQPSIVYWSRHSEKTERKVQIKLDERYLNEIGSIEYDRKLLTVSEESDPSGHFDRILSILPNSFDKQLRQTILIKANGENDFTTEIKLQVYVQP